jgi:UDP-N-acetylmuramoyl-L-alanyl-D-glutamate--2,6-diaminopimelate ligase
MRLDEAIAALEPREILGGGPVELADLAYDARQVTPGALFFCVPGEKADGHDFAAEAIERGTVALVVERPLDVGVPQLVVADSRAAMAVVADAFFAFPTRDLTVVAVTGTNGKTTTAHLMLSILDAAGKRPGLLGNIERRIGSDRRPAVLNTPEAIDLQRLFREMLDAGNESVAMEASSHASALHRLDRTRFAVLVFTNLTQDHLDFHGSMDDYFEAKRRLFAQADAAAVNVGDEYGRRLAQELPDALTFGAVEGAAVGPAALEGIDLKLRGGFNAENALGALAAGRLLGFDDETIRRGIEALEARLSKLEQQVTALSGSKSTPARKSSPAKRKTSSTKKTG